MVHRDIKPANIIISTDGHPILADFGIAKVADRPGLTLTGATIGTPTYMSPEQCGAEPVTGATDQYSLGVTAFEMLTGAPPFDAPSHMTLMLKQMSEPAPLVQGRAPGCPADLAAVIDRMLAKEPSDRFTTMESIIEALQAGTITSTHKVRTQLVSYALADPDAEQLKRVGAPADPIPAAPGGAASRAPARGRPLPAPLPSVPHWCFSSGRRRCSTCGGRTIARSPLPWRPAAPHLLPSSRATARARDTAQGGAGRSSGRAGAVSAIGSAPPFDQAGSRCSNAGTDRGACRERGAR